MELLYRKTQRQLGEAQVALRLLADLFKVDPKIPGIEEAVVEAHKVKSALFRRVCELEERFDRDREVYRDRVR